MDEGGAKPGGDVGHVWRLMEKIDICMLITAAEGSHMSARPMGAYVREEDGRIYFLSDARSVKDDIIARAPEVLLTFADTHGNKFVSLAGRAEVSNDRAKIAELFNTPAKAWWGSADDPNIRVLKVVPREAQYWDSPGALMSAIIMMGAAESGHMPELGESKKVEM